MWWAQRISASYCVHRMISWKSSVCVAKPNFTDICFKPSYLGSIIILSSRTCEKVVSFFLGYSFVIWIKRQIGFTQGLTTRILARDMLIKAGWLVTQGPNWATAWKTLSCLSVSHPVLSLLSLFLCSAARPLSSLLCLFWQIILHATSELLREMCGAHIVAGTFELQSEK